MAIRQQKQFLTPCLFTPLYLSRCSNACNIDPHRVEIVYVQTKCYF